MEKMSEDYRRREVDLKRLYLCSQGKLWLLLLLTILGAVIGGVSYQVIKATRMPITYAAVSKLYISFGVDESGEVYQYYNGYTWNDLLDTDPVLDRIMEYVPEGYSRKEVQEATTAEILSDIRLLTITVEGGTEKFVREIQSAVEEGLVDYARDSAELKRIDVIRTEDPVRVYWDDKTATAAVIGGVVFAVISCLIAAFLYLLDDAVYVQEDIEKKYSCKPLGILLKKQKGLQPYARELQADFSYILAEHKCFGLIDMDDHCIEGKEDLELVLNAVPGEFVGGDGEAGGLTWTLPKSEEEQAQDVWHAEAFDEGMLSEKELARIRELGGAVLLIPFGKDVSRRTSRVLTLLSNQDCPVFGMVISGADEDFVNRYYR